jgi:hypothetical protein
MCNRAEKLQIKVERVDVLMQKYAKLNGDDEDAVVNPVELDINAAKAGLAAQKHYWDEQVNNYVPESRPRSRVMATMRQPIPSGREVSREEKNLKKKKDELARRFEQKHEKALRTVQTPRGGDRVVTTRSSSARIGPKLVPSLSKSRLARNITAKKAAAAAAETGRGFAKPMTKPKGRSRIPTMRSGSNRSLSTNGVAAEPRTRVVPAPTDVPSTVVPASSPKTWKELASNINRGRVRKIKSRLDLENLSRDAIVVVLGMGQPVEGTLTGKFRVDQRGLQLQVQRKGRVGTNIWAQDAKIRVKS